MSIDLANNKFVELKKRGQKTKRKGFVFNGYYNGGRFSCQFIRMPSAVSSTLEFGSLPKVRLLDVDEINGITSKYGERLISTIPFDGHVIGVMAEIFTVNRRGTVIPASEFTNEKLSILHPVWLESGVSPGGSKTAFTTNTNSAVARTCLSCLIDRVRTGLLITLEKARLFNPNAKLTWKNVLKVPRGDIESSSCHFYFGLDGLDEDVYKSIVKSIDAIWGVISVSLFRNMEDERRRFHCGKAGDYEITKGGLAYKVPSSVVLAHPVLLNLAFDIARVAVSIGMKGMGNMWMCSDKEVASTINSHNVLKARRIIKRNNGVLKAILKRRYKLSVAAKVLDMIYSGAPKYLDDLDDMEAAWRLNRAWANYAESDNCSVCNTEKLA